jgi:hypothetical protein
MPEQFTVMHMREINHLRCFSAPIPQSAIRIPQLAKRPQAAQLVRRSNAKAEAAQTLSSCWMRVSPENYFG